MKKIIVCVCILLLVGFCWVHVRNTDADERENEYADSAGEWITERVSDENLQSYQEQGAEMIHEADEAIGNAVQEVNQVIGDAVEGANEAIGDAVEQAMEGAAKGFWESIQESASNFFDGLFSKEQTE